MKCPHCGFTLNSALELSGEVRGKAVYIYERGYEEAVKTLRHEVIYNLVNQAIEPTEKSRIL